VYVALVVAVGLDGSSDDPVDEPEPELPADLHPAEDLPGMNGGRRGDAERHAQQDHDVKAEEGDDGAGGEVCDNPHAELAAGERETAIKRGDERSDQAPRPELREVGLQLAVEASEHQVG